LAIGSKLLEAAQAALYPGSKLVDKDSHLSKHDYDRLVIINPTPWLQRRELVQAGSALLSVYPSGQGHDYKLPGTKQVSASEDAPWTQAKRVGDQAFTLSNRAISMKIEDGRITSLFDNQLERELIPEKSTGGFILFEDQPANWDAWDADIYHLEKFTRLTFSNVSIAENGHNRASLKAMVETGSSKIEIKVSVPVVLSDWAFC
jgi:alpha-mannosidase